MKVSFPLRGIGSCVAMLILILDSNTALEGAKAALNLIFDTVIPSLFPFFFLSILLTSVKGPGHYRLLRPVGLLFQIPEGQEYLLLPGFLGGYPAGAQAITSACEQGFLSRDTAERLLGFCSNAGPSFLFGILAAQFPQKWMAWALWFLHISGALLASRMVSQNSGINVGAPYTSAKTLSEVLSASMKVMGNVCGWLLLFRVLLAFLERWILWLLPESAGIFCTGLLELTNGCCLLNRITDLRLRFLICSILLSLGGLCVFLQTQSVTKDLSLRYYIRGKLIQAIYSGTFAAVLMYHTVYPLVISIILVIPYLEGKKRSSIPESAGV